MTVYRNRKYQTLPDWQLEKLQREFEAQKTEFAKKHGTADISKLNLTKAELWQTGGWQQGLADLAHERSFRRPPTPYQARAIKDRLEDDAARQAELDRLSAQPTDHLEIMADRRRFRDQQIGRYGLG